MSESVPRILLVDDTPDNLEALVRALRSERAELLKAEDGEAAWALVDRDPAVDLVLLDLMMPRLDGLSLLRRLKADARFRQIPVILQTADTAPERIAEGIAAGAFYYLTKPLDLRMLRGIVRSALETRAEVLDVQREPPPEGLTLVSLHRAEFRYRSPEEARALAALLMRAFPEPERVAMGVWELLINAVEHGNLEISYMEKTRLLQERRMLAEVALRLGLPEYRDRMATATLERDEEGLTLTVEDEGPGFEWQPFLTLSPARAFHTHGRGIAMAKALSFDEIRYEGRGNRVVARVKLRPGS
ncbi:MAG TPA: response regulator [Holophagaceae bacterium]|nr:response regulator [Holophagaceae bacterium]